MSRKNCAEVRCGYLNCHSNKCDCFEIVTKRAYQRKDHIARVFMRLVLSLFLFPCCCRVLFIWNASHACLCGLFWEGFSTIVHKTHLWEAGHIEQEEGRGYRCSLLLFRSLALSLSCSLSLLLTFCKRCSGRRCPSWYSWQDTFASVCRRKILSLIRASHILKAR